MTSIFSSRGLAELRIFFFKHFSIVREKKREYATEKLPEKPKIFVIWTFTEHVG